MGPAASRARSRPATDTRALVPRVAPFAHPSRHTSRKSAHATAANLCSLGVWRSLVARSVRVGEVPSSNLGTPISLDEGRLAGLPREPAVLVAPRFRYGSGTDTLQLAVYRRCVNVVTLIGNLATDVEVKSVGESKRVASFVLAVDRAVEGRWRGLRSRRGLGPAGRALRPLPRKGKARRARRPAAQPVVGGRRRHAAERARGRREPRRVPLVAVRRGGRREVPFAPAAA